MSFLSDLEIVAQALDEYYQQSISREFPVIEQVPMEELIPRLELDPLVSTGGLSGERLSRFIENYLASTTRVYHPAYIAHQQAVPHYAAALAGLVDGFANTDGGIYELGPAAVSVEYFLVNWFLEKVGWTPAPVNASNGEQEYGGGILTQGGSVANLTALIAARSRVAPEVWHEGNPGDLVLLAPAESHYSIARAAGIMGLGHKAIYHLAVDDRGVVIPDRLASVYEHLENDGKRTIALIANACSTAVGLYDPLYEIGEFCRERNLHFHVDGAHGASALLTDKYRGLMKGVELADSLTWNAHKLMRTPAVCTALLVRDHRTLDNAFKQDASYIFHEKEQPGYDFIHRTIECTKAVLGLKLFLVLAALGERELGEYVELLFELTLEAYEYITGQPDFECAVKPQSNILCFRTRTGHDQLAVRDRLNARGNFYLSATGFSDKQYLRVALMNPETSMDDVKGMIREIRHLTQTD
jgi:L-2,4-diaminobutyrate decarboxylase